MTSSNGNIYRVTGHLCGEFTGPRWIPHTKAMTRSFDVFFDMRPNKQLSNFRRWVACKVSGKISKFKFLAIFKICNFDFVFLWLGIWCESLVWVIISSDKAARGISERRHSRWSSCNCVYEPNCIQSTLREPKMFINATCSYINGPRRMPCFEKMLLIRHWWGCLFSLCFQM